MARLDEVVLCYNKDPEFKRRIDFLPFAVWVDQIGLTSSGCYKIGGKGSFVKITESEFNNLDTKDRAQHYPGDSLVALAGGCSCWRLDVFGNAGPDYAAYVALVALEKGTEKFSDPAAELKGLSRERDQALLNYNKR